MSLANKKIVLGVTGSIAAYKAAELLRLLIEAGATVRVVMTENAKRFITPLSMQALSHAPVHEDLFDPEMEAAMGHIALARWADLILIAPASLNCLASLADGRAHDLLTTLCLATHAKIAVAPAMNQAMWQHDATTKHCVALKARGVYLLEPTYGKQACGDIGPGRLLDILQIVEQVSALFESHALDRVRVLMTLGPTREALDPVRYLTNGSSGKMGLALAEAFYEAGASVSLVSGPLSVAIPSHFKVTAVTTACEMHEAVMSLVGECDLFVSVAAVSDYRAETIAPQKIKKTADTLTLTLVKNPDIMTSVSALPHPPFLVGFAMETEDLLAHAREKRVRKKMDIIIANLLTETTGAGSDENAVTVIDATSETTLPCMAKSVLARTLVAHIAAVYAISVTPEPESAKLTVIPAEAGTHCSTMQENISEIDPRLRGDDNVAF